MTKDEFINQLSIQLKPLSAEEREKSLSYYRELIEDKMENGFSEEEAVAQLEAVCVISQNIISDWQEQNSFRAGGQAEHFDHTPPAVSRKGEKLPDTSSRIVGKVFAILLGFIKFIMHFTLYVVAFTLALTLWITVIAFIAAGFALMVGSVALIPAIFVNMAIAVPAGVMIIGMAIVLASSGLLLIFASIKAIKAFTVLIKNIFSKMRKKKGGVV